MYIARKEPIVHPEYPKPTSVPHVWQLAPNIFTYSDQTDDLTYSLFNSIEDAEKALNEYAEWLCQDHSDSFNESAIIPIGEYK